MILGQITDKTVDDFCVHEIDYWEYLLANSSTTIMAMSLMKIECYLAGRYS